MTEWRCGCGWVNGANLDHCARCCRDVTEGNGVLLDPEGDRENQGITNYCKECACLQRELEETQALLKRVRDECTTWAERVGDIMAGIYSRRANPERGDAQPRKTEVSDPSGFEGLGLYRVYWDEGPSSQPSVAAIGQGPDGTLWLAPSNWICPSVAPNWAQVKRVALIEKQDSPDAFGRKFVLKRALDKAVELASIHVGDTDEVGSLAREILSAVHIYTTEM